MLLRDRRRPAVEPISEDEGRDDDRRLSRRWSKRIAVPPVVEYAVVTGGSLVLGVVLTWPLAIHPATGVYGFGNDKFGGIWNIKWVHDTALWRGHQSFTHEIQYPFGGVFDDRVIQ